jgi:peptidoglycan-N-acetylglucosamine deacetylase
MMQAMRVALTFDDGPGPSTEALLDVLAAARVRATFFVLGRNIDEVPWSDPAGDRAGARALIVRALREGHVIGNHTYSHARPDRHLELPGDLRRCDDVIRGLRAEAGVPVDAPIPVRLPYGIRLVEQTIPTPTGTTNAVAIDPRLAVLASLGRNHTHWTADFDDWTLVAGDGPKLAAGMLAHVERNAALGLDAVCDLHDSGTGSSWGYARPATVEGVRALCEELARRGIGTFTVPCESAT